MPTSKVEFLREVVEAVLEGGKITLRYFRNDPSRSEKSKDNPVTVADTEVNQFLLERLGGLDSSAAWLSEESHDRFEDRVNARRLWIVDPLDATKEFIDGVPDYSVIVALVVDGECEYAVVYNPPRQQMFTAVRGDGAWLNGRRIHTSRVNSIAGSRILVSRSDLRKGKWDGYPKLTFFGVGGSGYKMCLVASGMADASINLAGLSEWDVAGPSLVIQEAGGVALNLVGQPFIFNTEAAKVGGQISAGTLEIAERLRTHLFQKT